MPTSSYSIERTLKESSFFMLSLTQTLMQRERAVCLELQATHDILFRHLQQDGEGEEAESLQTWEVTVQNIVRAFTEEV